MVKCLKNSDCSTGYCSDVTLTCSTPYIGDPCASSSKCHSDLECSSELGRCVMKGSTPRSSCIFHHDCRSSSYCDGGTCYKKHGYKENCSLDLECRDGLGCLGGKCVYRCLKNSDCSSNEACDVLGYCDKNLSRGSDSNSSSSTPTTSGTSNSPRTVHVRYSSTISPGTAICIVIGVLFVLGAIFAGIIICLIKRRRNKDSARARQPPLPMQGQLPPPNVIQTPAVPPGAAV